MSRLGIHVITDNHFSADMFVNMGIKKGKMVLINTKNLYIALMCKLDTTCQQLLDGQSYFYLSTT